jgi:hypothetical protein
VNTIVVSTSALPETSFAFRVRVYRVEVAKTALSNATLVLAAFQAGLPRLMDGLLLSSRELLVIASLKVNPNFALIGTALSALAGRLEIKLGGILSLGLGVGLVGVPPHATNTRANIKMLSCFSILLPFSSFFCVPNPPPQHDLNKT